MPDECDFTGERWPLRDELLLDFVAEEKWHGAGFMNHAGEIRAKHRCDVVVPQGNGVPADKKFVHRLACSERHPGLCYTGDRHHYFRCIEMATSLERFFADDQTRKFFLLFTPGGLETCVYFCHRRGRTPLTQVTHVFALCISDINDDDDDSSITFDPP